MLGISPTTAIFATGNNLQIHGDLTRRFLICQLDAGMEHPERRQFSRDLLAEASARRAELISAALIIARYGFRLDPCDYDGGFPGFQDWYRRVALPLVALGIPDPVKSLDLARATDTEAEALEQLMIAWCAAVKDMPLSCRKIVERPNVNLQEALRAVAADRHGEFCPRALGYYLKRIQNRPIGGKRFLKAGKSAEGVLWQLVDSTGKSR
jgi:putative DNA primase/helicase